MEHAMFDARTLERQKRRHRTAPPGVDSVQTAFDVLVGIEPGRERTVIWNGLRLAPEIALFREVVNTIWHSSREQPASYYQFLIRQLLSEFSRVERRRARFVWLLDDARRRYVEITTETDPGQLYAWAKLCGREPTEEIEQLALDVCVNLVINVATNFCDAKFAELNGAKVRSELVKLTSDTKMLEWIAKHDPVVAQHRQQRSGDQGGSDADTEIETHSPPEPVRRGRGAITVLGTAAKLSVSVGAFGDGGATSRGTAPERAARHAFSSALKEVFG